MRCAQPGATRRHARTGLECGRACAGANASPQLLPAGAQVEWFASTPAARRRAPTATANRRGSGCDRFAAAIGARALAPGQDLIVATCGTATTVDAVRADGRFLGGMILPGLALMAASWRATRRSCRRSTPRALPPLFADNTHDAILSGLLSAQAGAIERAVAGTGRRCLHRLGRRRAPYRASPQGCAPGGR